MNANELRATELADWLHVAGAAGTGKVREMYDAIEVVLRKHDASHPAGSEANEALAAKLRAESLLTDDGKPEGTREALETCVKMIDAYAADALPANERGQIHFARAMMESTADEIRVFLAGEGQIVAAMDLLCRARGTPPKTFVIGSCDEGYWCEIGNNPNHSATGSTITDAIRGACVALGIDVKEPATP